MSQFNRRELLKSGSLLLAASQFAAASVTGINLRRGEITRKRWQNRLRHRNKCYGFRGGADGFVRRARLRAIAALEVTAPRVWIHDAGKVDPA
jgi:hypothetical protein